MKAVVSEAALLWQLNGYGGFTERMMAVASGVTVSSASRRLRRWENAGLVIRRAMPLLREAVFFPAAAACASNGDSLPAATGIRPATFYHDATVLRVDVALREAFGGTFTPARRLSFDRSCSQKPEKRHLPDGVFVGAGKGPVAVEVELTRKSPRRLRETFDAYRRDLEVAKVLWIVSDPLMENYVKRFFDPAESGYFQVEQLNTVILFGSNRRAEKRQPALKHPVEAQ